MSHRPARRCATARSTHAPPRRDSSTRSAPTTAQGTSQGADGTQLKTTPSTASAQTGITAGPQTGAEPVDQPAFVVVNFIIVA
jgi:hypothetical protein